MNSMLFKYPLDYSGTLKENNVALPITLPTGPEHRAHVLPFGPMFTDTARVSNASSPATPLTRGRDYQFIINNPDLITRCRGREICHAIVVFNPKVSDNIVVTGNIVGGPYGTNLEAIEQIVQAIKADTRKIKWSNLLEVPSEYVAAPSYYDVGDVYGFEYIIMALGQIESAIRLKNNAEMVRLQEMITEMRQELLTMFQTHIDEDGNVHSLTRAQINVYSTGEVDNIFQQAVVRFNTLVAELGKLENMDTVLAGRIEAVVDSTANYVSQIVASNLEHQKNTLEIARISEGLAAAQRRLNEHALLIAANKQNHDLLVERFNQHEQTNASDIEAINEAIGRLGEDYVPWKQVNREQGTTVSQVNGRVPMVSSGGSVELGNVIRMRDAAGNSSRSTMSVYGDGIYFSAMVSFTNYYLRSDRRCKEQLEKLNVEQAYRLVDEIDTFNYKYIGYDAEETGLIAQHVRKRFPNAVVEHTDLETKKKILHIKPMALIGVLFAVVKGIRKELIQHRKTKDEVSMLKKRVAALEKQIRKP